MEIIKFDNRFSKLQKKLSKIFELITKIPQNKFKLNPIRPTPPTNKIINIQPAPIKSENILRLR